MRKTIATIVALTALAGCSGSDTDSSPVDDDNVFWSYYQEWDEGAQTELCEMRRDEGIQTTVWFVKQGTVEAPEADIIEVVDAVC